MGFRSGIWAARDGVLIMFLCPHFDWPGCVEWNIVLLGGIKTILRVRKHCQQVFIRDNPVCGLNYVNFNYYLTKLHLPYSSFPEATPDHHILLQSFSAFPNTWK